GHGRLPLARIGRPGGHGRQARIIQRTRGHISRASLRGLRATKRRETMGLLLAVLLLIVVLAVLGFAVVKFLLWIAIVAFLLWLIGFFVRGAEGARWYRWYARQAWAPPLNRLDEPERLHGQEHVQA